MAAILRFIVFSFLVMLGAVGYAQKPIISYASPQIYTVGTTISPLLPTNTGGPVLASSPIRVKSGFSKLTSIAVDGAGNIYFAEKNTNTVGKIPAGGGNPVLLGSGFNMPTGVAVDVSGNVYVADYGNKAIKKIPASGGGIVTIFSSENSPYGIAIDHSGNVFFSEEEPNAGIVKEIPFTGSAPITYYVGYMPEGLAVDAVGNVYVALAGSNQIRKILPGGGGPDLGAGNGNPVNVAVDALGNVYFADTNNSSIIKIPADGGTRVNVGTGLSSPEGVAVTASGDVYVIDNNDSEIKEIRFTGYAIDKPLPQGLSFDTNTGVISGTPRFATAPATYQITCTNSYGSSTFAINLKVDLPTKPQISYNGPQVYTTTVPVSTLSPINSGGIVPKQNVTTISADFIFVNGLAVNGKGDIYVLDDKTLKMIPPGSKTPVLIASGFNFLVSVTLDKIGNIYVADANDGVIKKIPASGGPPVVIGPKFNHPNGVAVDNEGNILVTDITKQIKKMSADGNGVSVLPIVGLRSPNALTVDAAGNIYVTDFGLVKKISANSITPVVLSDGKYGAYSIAVDKTGNIYYGSNQDVVVRIDAGGGPDAVIASNFSAAVYGVSVDVNGNLYTAAGHDGIGFINPGGYFLSPDLPAGLNFDNSTGVISGTPVSVNNSPATNYTITGYNAGGNSAAIVNIAVNHYPLPEISYQTPQTFTIGKAVTPPVTPKTKNTSMDGSYKTLVAASGLLNDRKIAIDAAGNIYAAEMGYAMLKKIPVNGTSPITIPLDFNSPYDFTSPSGVAIDNKGTIFIADGDHGKIEKIAVGGSSSTAIVSGLNAPNGLVMDKHDNLYFINFGNGLIQKIPASGGVPVTIGPTLSFANDVSSSSIDIALDADENVYVNTGHSIQKIPVGSNSANVLFNTSSLISGLAVNTYGDIFYGDLDSQFLKKISASGGAVTTLADNIAPFGIVIDERNIIYVGDPWHNAIKKVSPSGGFFISPSLPPGLIFDSATGFISGTPTAISPATDYLVTAYNQGGSASATVNIRVRTGTDLNSLALNSGVLTPEFTPGVNVYSASVSNATASITLTPVTDDPASTVKVNGIAVASGTASPAIALAVGSNVVNTIVTAADGVTTKTYTLTVTRVSTNAKLLTIKTNPKTTLTGVTGPGFGNYTTTVPFSEGSLTLTATAADAGATIKVNGTTVASGAASQPISLDFGDNVITIIVTAQDGIATKTYYITATRATSPIATLSNLALSAGTLSPGFATTTTGYTAIVPNAASSIKITPAATDANAAIKINGVTVASGASLSFPLAVGTNTMTTVVTAQDGTSTETYTVSITRAAAGLSTEAKLLTIKPNPKTTLTGVAGPGFGNYTTTVPNNESSITFISTAADANATIKVNGIAVASGATSQAIPLAVGDNVITIIVTAQDGATTKTYFITATRAASSIATLSNLALSAGTLSPVFATATTGYTAIVPNAASSIKITPTVMEANATITVNGVTVASGAASPAIALAVGTNAITTVATAQDGTTTKTYTLTVTRAAAGLSTEARLLTIKPNPKTTLTVVAGPGFGNYTTAVPNSESSVTLTSTAIDATASIKVNGTPVASGAASQSIPLNVGDNVITIIVTAQDGATTKTYYITATRAAGSMVALYVDGQADKLKADGIVVHQGVSPNGDGDNDVLTIDGIAAYPDNSLQIMNRSGALVYEAKGYNNTTKVFDGHSSSNGKLQQAGTYFYSLEYKDGGETKYKTGFIVLKR